MNDPRTQQNRIQPAPARIQPAPARVQPPDDDLLELEPADEPHDPLSSVSLVDDDPNQPAPVSKIKAFGVAGSGQRNHDWKRHTKAPGTGAVRVRTFHCKFSEQGTDFLDNQINEWLDSHPEVEIKFVTSTVGVFEGKIREPALVLNLWY